MRGKRVPGERGGSGMKRKIETNTQRKRRKRDQRTKKDAATQKVRGKGSCLGWHARTRMHTCTYMQKGALKGEGRGGRKTKRQ